jgi:uncharacterized protein YbaR (Trm112 family)
MIPDDLLKLLVCPEDRSPVTVASTALIARINDAIGRRLLKNRADRILERPLAGGLLRGDQAVLYPIVDEIPMMLVDEGIPLHQPALATSSG